MFKHWLLFLLYLSAAVQAQTDDGWLRITFPACGDTFAAEWLRLSGAVPAQAGIRVQERSVRVWPQGAFVDRVQLAEGWNRIPIQATLAGATRSDTLHIYRIPPLKTSPETPLTLDPALLEPAADLWLTPGETFFVTCKGSPGATARFCLEGETAALPMQERRSGDVKGLYEGWMQAPHGPLLKPLQVWFELTAADGQQVQHLAPGRLILLSPESPAAGRVLQEAQLWSAAREGTVVGLLPDGVLMRVSGKMNGRYKVRFGSQQAAYVDTSELVLQPPGTVVAPAALSSPAIASDKDWLYFSFPISRPVPFLVAPQTDQNRLTITFYDVFQSPLWTSFPDQLPEIRQVSWQQVAEKEVQIHLVLGQAQMWGCRVRYQEGRVQVMVRRAPRLGEEVRLPLKGLRIAVDPGHGGEEMGAVSPTGLWEKEINLDVARQLAQSLEAAGAQVLLTRSADVVMTRQMRHRAAQDFAAHILISLHHNAAPATADAVRAAGTSTYHTWPQSRALAQSIYARLRKTGLKPFGQIWSSFYTTRIADMLSVLVEVAFMSSPGDEQRMLEEGYAKTMARAITAGVTGFISSRPRGQEEEE